LPATDPGDVPAAYADLLDRIRAGYALTDVDHAAVDRELALYRSQPDLLDRTFRRGARYLHYIVEEIDKRGMPMELALLPVVESAFNPLAYSRSRASGLWQFMPRTGRHYGLDQNWWLDERRDVIESTQAALTYLDYLHRYFDGDWFLAIAAYNGGEGTVSRAMSASRPRHRLLRSQPAHRDATVRPQAARDPPPGRRSAGLRAPVRADTQPAVLRGR
jgi:membrane-bound lytic murein transglycosylase D